MTRPGGVAALPPPADAPGGFLQVRPDSIA